MSQNLVKIGLIILASLASVGVVVTSFYTARRVGLFTQAQEEYGPIQHPQVQTSHQSAIIRWQSRSPVVSVVKYGTNANNLAIPVFEAVQTTNHAITVDNLLSDSTYYYEIVANNQVFRDIDGKPYSFTTLPAVNPTPTYPPCDLEKFNSLYGTNQGEPGYDAAYDINGDGTINNVDYFRCIQVNPPQ